ncbi:MAG TPA: sigma 54-interacting transcriptional regulator [Thermodesulfobacteriota bacterium]|nr:sigma 54-interacting transcriptional regulator [Thermodesulfobacteriota bacterium]
MDDSEKSRYNELILNAAGEGLASADINGNLTFINPAGAKMLGWEVEELISRPGHDIMHHTKPDGSPYPLEECPIYAAFQDGVVRFEDNEMFWRKDGSSFPVEYTSTPIREGGKFVGTVLVFRDITARKAAEKTLRETLGRLSKMNRYESIISVVTRTVHRTINLQEVLDNAVEALSENIDKAQHVSIYMVEGGNAIMRAYRGYPDWFVERVKSIPYPAGLTWKIITDGKPRYCANVDHDKTIGPAAREAGIKSYLCMPVFLEGKSVGTINVSSLHKNVFDKEEIQLLKNVAQQVGTAINNAHQAEALKKALSKVEELKNRLQAENIYLREEIKTEYNFDEIIGRSEALMNVLRKVEHVAPTEATVLIQGETGTGKELVARAIHHFSLRKDRPLVKVNCPALPAGLIESELFGHEKGAFTGALSPKTGRFELADGGTIFLDEIGDLPLELQAKLLRVLQEGEFERLGGSRSIKVSVRVIAATNRDLKQAVEEGKFRADLFYRLNVFPVFIPPLRERREDIPVLVGHFITKYSKKLEKKIDNISQEMMNGLLAHPWPGNVRELENVIERAVIVAHSPVIQIDESLDMRLEDTGPDTRSAGTLEDVERNYILRVLEDKGWVIHGERGAAVVLGMNPHTLRSRMKKLGIRKPGGSG